MGRNAQAKKRRKKPYTECEILVVFFSSLVWREEGKKYENRTPALKVIFIRKSLETCVVAQSKSQATIFSHCAIVKRVCLSGADRNNEILLPILFFYSNFVDEKTNNRKWRYTVPCSEMVQMFILWILFQLAFWLTSHCIIFGD